MPRQKAPDLDVLLAHSGWLRRLAHRLVGDVHVADDVAQETYLRAIERPPTDGSNPRGWLATILRNLVRQRDRAERRRVRYERQASRSVTVPSTADLVSKLAGHRDLVSMVLELNEPYRTTIMLRYFAEKSARQITQELDVPLKTVHTRIGRGLAQLRDKLVARHGKGQWPLALLPLKIPRTSLPVLGGMLMKSKLVLALAALMVLSGAWLLFGQPWEPAEFRNAGGGDVGLGPVIAAKAQEAFSPEEEVLPRTSLAIPEEDPVGEETAMSIRGRVFAEDGLPRGGIEVGWYRDSSATGEPVGTSDVGGWFDAAIPDISGDLKATSPQIATLFTGLLMNALEFPVAIVIAPAQPLQGHVVDEEGAAIADAHVEILLPRNFRSRFDAILDASSRSQWVTKTDEAGYFDLRHAGRITGAQLFARADGWAPAVDEQPPGPRDDLRIVLERPAVSASSLTGLVVDPYGAPVPGAHVSLGRQIALTDGRGHFVFEPGRPGERLMAVKPGYLPAVRQVSQTTGELIELRLGQRPLAIRGTVVGLDGTGLSGMRVWISDPTPFGSLDRQPGLTAAESMVVGVPPSGEGTGGPARQSSLDWYFVHTGTDGGFEIGGLLDRSYSLFAMDPATMLVSRSEPIPAGTLDARIQMDRAARHAIISGRVVDGDGVPVPGVSVSPVIDAIVMPFGNTGTDTRHDSRPGTVTDAEGHFRLRDIPREHVYLEFRGVRILPHEVGRRLPGGFAEAHGGVTRDIEVVVSLRTHIKVDVTGGRADELVILDEQGEPVRLTKIIGDSTRGSRSLALDAEQSTTFVVDDSAHTLVLLQGGKEVLRERLQLVTGQINYLVF